MWIKELTLSNFRCYDSLKMEFAPGINILYGNNALGKTSILEAVHILGLTKSNRTNDDSVICKNNGTNYGIKGVLFDQNTKKSVILLYSNKIKKIKYNNNALNTLSEFIGMVPVIAYSPGEFIMFGGAPAQRRKFFDMILCQLSRYYLKTLSEYKRIIKERNIVLKELQLKPQNGNRDLLEVLTKQMVDKGLRLMAVRKKTISKISERASNIHFKMSYKEKLSIIYRPSMEPETYEKKAFSCLDEEIDRGATMYGPGKDDYIFIINNKNIGEYGSQGQQKSALLSIKISLIDLIYEVKKTYPIVLLDDVFGELDKERQNNLLQVLRKEVQTIVTTATIADLDGRIMKRAKVINLAERRA